MEPQRVESSTNNPSYFDRNNNSHWKVHMKFFLKMQEKHVWNFVEFRWETPLDFLGLHLLGNL